MMLTTIAAGDDHMELLVQHGHGHEVADRRLEVKPVLHLAIYLCQESGIAAAATAAAPGWERSAASQRATHTSRVLFGAALVPSGLKWPLLPRQGVSGAPLLTAPAPSRAWLCWSLGRRPMSSSPLPLHVHWGRGRLMATSVAFATGSGAAAPGGLRPAI